MKRTVGFGVTLLAGIGAVTALAWPNTEPTAALPEVAPMAESPDRDIDGRVDRLHREVIALRRGQPREALPNADPTAPEDEVAQAPPELTPEDVELELDAHLEAEERDLEWSEATELAVAEVFSGDMFPGMQLVETSCASTMCRVVVDAESDAAHDGFQTEMSRTPPFNTEGFARLSGDLDAPRVTFYFAREGEDLREAIN